MLKKNIILISTAILLLVAQQSMAAFTNMACQQDTARRIKDNNHLTCDVTNNNVKQFARCNQTSGVVSVEVDNGNGSIVAQKQCTVIGGSSAWPLNVSDMPKLNTACQTCLNAVKLRAYDPYDGSVKP